MGTLNIATNRIMACTTEQSINYVEWHKHFELLKMLTIYQVNGIDYLTLAHALLNTKVIIDNDNDKAEYNKEYLSLQEFAWEFENIQEYININPNAIYKER